MKPWICVIIPAYNESTAIAGVLERIFAIHDTRYTIHAVVVDDGSDDNTGEIARKSGATVLVHSINRGLGAALATGIAGALNNLEHCSEHSILVTLDADGQHDPTEILQLIEPIISKQADVVIGSRFLKVQSTGSKSSIPVIRILANWIGNVITWSLFDIWVTDTQSGFRAFSYNAAKKIKIRTSTMEVSSEIIREIKRNNLQYKEVPVTVSYTEYSLSKGQNFFKGIETLWKLIVLKFFR